MELPFETKEITQENYYQDSKYLTNSMMGMLDESPIKLRDYLNGKREVNDAFIIGDYLHTSILEPHKMGRFHVVNEDNRPNTKVGMTGKDNKAWLKDLKIEFGESNVISKKNSELCSEMSQSVLSKPECRDLLYGIGSLQPKYEHIFTSYIDGLDTKCMVDIDRSHIDSTIVDIKTTQDSSLNEFKKSFWKYGYFRQAAFYLRHTEATIFKFIVVEKKFPYKVGIYTVSERSLERGTDSYIRLMDKYKFYFTDAKEQVIDNSIMEGEL